MRESKKTHAMPALLPSGETQDTRPSEPYSLRQGLVGTKLPLVHNRSLGSFRPPGRFPFGNLAMLA